MARNKASGVSADEVTAMLRDAVARIERGGLKAITIRAMMTDGEEVEHTFSLETEEERDAALLTIRQILGQVH